MGNGLDAGGDPLTDAAKVNGAVPPARLRTPAIEMTIDDPKAYTKPWTTKINEVLAPDTTCWSLSARKTKRIYST